MPDPTTTTAVNYPVGIVGEHMEQAARQVPPSQPPPWPTNEKLNVVGKPAQRLDGRLKVTGAAKYTADINLPGMLFASMIASPHAHAHIKSIDTSAAESHPGVKAVHILDRDRMGAKVKPGSESLTLRYVGQPIGAVAALTQADADDAARLIKIEYEILPFVVDVDKAKEPGAPLVFKEQVEAKQTAGGGGGPAGVPQQGNVRGPAKAGHGDVAKGFTEADVIVEASFRTQVQTHSALETHGVVADWKPDQLTVYASTQGTATVRDDLANVFALKKSQVRVITEYMGGGFGAKFGAGNAGVLAAQLSKAAGAPVRLMMDRRQEHECTGNRPSSNQHVKIGAKKDGTLTVIAVTNYGTAGTSTGAGATAPAQHMYPCPNVSAEDSDVFTHAGPAAAFRAPGHPQGTFAFEQTIDELAEKLAMDPLALREKIDDSYARAAERKIGAAKIGWSQRKPAGSDPGPIKRGIGMAQGTWFRGADPGSRCEVRLTHDGSVEVMSAVQDIGGGIRTAMAQCVAEELGLKPADITMKIGDTSFPHGNASGGSMTTNSMTPVARNAAYQVKRQLLEQIAPQLESSPDQLVMADEKISVKDQPTRSLEFHQAAAKMKGEQISAQAERGSDFDVPTGGRHRGGGSAGGVQFVQVAVDTETGQIKVERVVAVHDCGRPINPLALESQINGGVIQGISYALYENRILDHHLGAMVNANLDQYKIIGAKDIPQIEPIVIEQYWAKSSTDAGPIGEPATVPTAAAIANAVYHAIGVRIREIPMTPAVVLAALARTHPMALEEGTKL